METIVGVAIGGILAIAGGIIGSLVQAKRDHVRWVRERRYEALYALLEMVDADAYKIRMNLEHDLTPGGMVAMQRIATRVAFVGSEKMRAASEELRLSIVALDEDGDTERFDLARSRYLVESQKILGTLKT